jgi:hypothetical protein
MTKTWFITGASRGIGRVDFAGFSPAGHTRRHVDDRAGAGQAEWAAPARAASRLPPAVAGVV